MKHKNRLYDYRNHPPKAAPKNMPRSATLLPGLPKGVKRMLLHTEAEFFESLGQQRQDNNILSTSI